ncbi:hypothetical protein D2A34_12985 [Clostridium chromiireducens]|uniref:Uncharacterized protein n=1 Tax=Clostridium chromiireducens TaxID=225345 RepID=A0A399ITC1_9CLOT|nr:hypothetical protein [Clostridium chromiireducens]RII34086.1 hypothetical protein D2A34_12985 [Clostridium chromiireducens]
MSTNKLNNKDDTNDKLIECPFVINAGGTPSIQEGPIIERPAPKIKGRLYLDTKQGILYRDTGKWWVRLQLGPRGPQGPEGPQGPPGPDPTTRFQVSGDVGGADNFNSGIPFNSFRNLQRISINIPSGTQLVINRIRYYFANSFLRLRIAVGSTIFLSSSNANEETPAFVLYNNTTAVPILVTLEIGTQNTNPDPNTPVRASGADGWWIDLSFV